MGRYQDLEQGGEQDYASPTLMRQGSSRDGKGWGATSHWYLDEDEYYQGAHDARLRLQFASKVYSMLALQLGLTALIAWGIAFHEGPRQSVLDLGVGGLVLIVVGMVASLFGLFYFKNRPGWNLAALTHFTAWMSVDVGIICARYYEAGYAENIVISFALTMAVFLCLTAVIWVTKADFSEFQGALLGLLNLMLLFVLFCWIFGYEPGRWYSFLGALVFVGFILVDTSLIMRRFGYEDWAIAVAELYLDIVNLFIFVLQITSGGRK